MIAIAIKTRLLYAQYVKDAVLDFGGKGHVGAFILESGISVRGVILPRPSSFVREAVRSVREAYGLYIADEVQTGFGRYGHVFWGFEHGSSLPTPDIVTVGKAFGNAMPLAAVMITDAVASDFEQSGMQYFNAFVGNPVCAAAGLAVMKTLDCEHLQQNAMIVGSYMKQKFMQLQDEFHIIGDVRGVGMFLGIEFVRDQNTLEAASNEATSLINILKDKYNFLTSIDGPLGNVMVIKPPMVFSKDDVDEFLEAFRSAIACDLVGDIGEYSADLRDRKL